MDGHRSEHTGIPWDIVVLDEWSWTLPVTETNTIMRRSSSKVEDYSKNDQSYDCNDLDGTARKIAQATLYVVEFNGGTYAKTNSASP